MNVFEKHLGALKDIESNLKTFTKRMEDAIEELNDPVTFKRKQVKVEREKKLKRIYGKTI